MPITDKKELERFSECHRVWQGIPGIEHTKGGRTFVTFYSGGATETYGNYVLLYKSYRLCTNDAVHSNPRTSPKST